MILVQLTIQKRIDNKQTPNQSGDCLNSIFSNNTKEGDFVSDFEAVINIAQT